MAFDYEKFVRVWQRSANAEAAAAECGIHVKSARTRAANLRKHGVPLKKMRAFGGGAKINYKALAGLVAKPGPG